MILPIYRPAVALLGAVLMVVCGGMTPVVVTVIARAGLPLMPYLLALAMSANLGSVATLADRSARGYRTLRR